MKRRANVKARPAEEDSPKSSKLPKKAKLEDPLPVGEILHDTEERGWTLDAVLGEGHLGPIYSASSQSTKDSTEYVIKIEPINSGHLFKEFNFYQRVAKKKSIETWKKNHSLPHLGVPYLEGLGQHTHGDHKNRFLVLQRLGPDLTSLMERSGALLSMEAVFWLGIRMLDCLEYIHDHDYVHGDISASNILLGYSSGEIDDNEVYLVDYGLAYRYRVNGKQKPYQENPKQTLEGNITFTSREAHKGVAPSRRGDLEILGYCLLQWLCGRLPWEDKLSDKNYVRDSKNKYMENIPSFVKMCMSQDGEDGSLAADTMISYFNYVSGLDYEGQPDYDVLRQLLRDFLSEAGITDEWRPDLLSQNEASRSRRPLEKGPSEAVKSTKETTKGKSKQKGKPSKVNVVEEQRTLIDTSSKTTKPTQSRRGGRTRKSMSLQSSLPKEDPLPVVQAEETFVIHSTIRSTKVRKGKDSQHDHPKPQSESKRLVSHPSGHASRTSQDASSSNEKVTLNVGGKTFVTFMSTLQRCPSKLSEMASDCKLQSEIFIDRDSTYFSYILNYLRDEQTTLPVTAQDLRRLHEESVFYDLTPLAERIEEHLKFD